MSVDQNSLGFLEDRRNGLIIDLKDAVTREEWAEVLTLSHHLIALETRLDHVRIDPQDTSEH